MTSQELIDRYQISEEELAGLIRKNLKRLAHGRRNDQSASAVKNAEEATGKKSETIINGNSVKDTANESDADSIAQKLQGKIADLEERLTQKDAEYNALQHEYLTSKSESSAQTANLLSDVEREKKKAEDDISRMRESHESYQRFSALRIEELESRNNELQERLESVHEELRKRTDELARSKRENQELTNTVNQKCAKAALDVLDAQHSRDNLKSVLHQKEIRIANLEEEKHELMEENQRVHARIDEILGKIKTSRETVYKAGAEFDEYFSLPAETDDTRENVEADNTAKDERDNAEVKAPQNNNNAISVLRKRFLEISSDAKEGILRRAASFF